MSTADPVTKTGKFAIIAGAVGLVGTGFLVAALFAPTPSPDSMRRETSLFLWQDAFVVLQALAMIPVTLGIARTPVGGGAKTLGLGLLAQVTLIVTTMLIFTGTVSDMLYMGPVGLVGAWLLMVNGPRRLRIPAKVYWAGSVAGTGLLLVGLGFVVYAIGVEPAVLVRPLSTNEIDAQKLTLANLVSHIFLALGTLLGRLVYPMWSLLLGAHLLRLGRANSAEFSQAAV